MRRLALSLLLVAITCTAAPSIALGKIVVTRLDEQGRWADLRIDGEITQKDADRFARLADLLRPHFELVTVELNSPGGSVLPAMQIGTIVRKDWFLTEISDGSDGETVDECDSACVYVFAAGVVRIAGAGSKIGIHRPYFDQKLFSGLSPEQAAAKYDELVRAVRSYLDRMGMKDKLVTDMLRIPSQDIRYLTYDQATEYALIGRSPAWEEYQRAKAITKYGPKAMLRFDAWLKRSDVYIENCERASSSPQKCAEQFYRRDPDPLKSK